MLEERSESKRCRACGLIKGRSAFGVWRGAGDGLKTVCRPCNSAATRRWRLANPEKQRAIETRRAPKTAEARAAEYAQRRAERQTAAGRLKWRNWRYRAGHGITVTEYEALLGAQDGRCAICQLEPRGAGPANLHLHVDHDHRTGTIRGLLCRACNTSIGQFDESPERLRAAATYLDHFRPDTISPP